MKEAGINFAVGLPNSQFHEVYEMITQDPDCEYVGVGEKARAPQWRWARGAAAKNRADHCNVRSPGCNILSRASGSKRIRWSHYPLSWRLGRPALDGAFTKNTPSRC